MALLRHDSAEDLALADPADADRLLPDRPFARRADPALRAWMLHDGSLTDRLARAHGPVRVTPTREGIGAPRPFEALLIGAPDSLDVVKKLIAKLDQPVDPKTQFEVFQRGVIIMRTEYTGVTEDDIMKALEHHAKIESIEITDDGVSGTTRVAVLKRSMLKSLPRRPASPSSRIDRP